MRTTLLAFLVSGVFCTAADAQVQADAEMLFRNAALHAFQNLPQMELTARIEIRNEGLEPHRKDVSVVVRKPDQAFASVKTSNDVETAVVSDGSLWVHSTYHHVWDARPGQLRPDSFLNIFAGAELVPRDWPLTQASIAGEDTLTIDGASFRCSRIEVAYRQPSGIEFDHVLWIDQQSGVPLKQRYAARVAHPQRIDVTVTRFRTNAPLPRGAFERRPAANAKEDSTAFERVPPLTQRRGDPFTLIGLGSLAGAPFALSDLEGQPAIFVFEGADCKPCADEVDDFDVAAKTLTGSSVKAFRVFIGDAATAPPGTSFVATAEQAERLGLQVLPATVPVSRDGRIGRINEGILTAAQMIRLAEDARAMATEAEITQKRFVMVGQVGVVAPVVIDRAPVVLNEQGRSVKIKGRVELSVRVSSEGSVYDVFVQRSLHPDLDAAAVEAVRHWTFKPGTRDGVPVNVGLSINVEFE